MRAAALSEASPGPAERTTDGPPSSVLRIKAVRGASEGGLSVARSARPGDTSDKAAVRIQVAVRTTPDTSCYDAKDHTTMAARGDSGKAEGRLRCGNCAHACSILGARQARKPVSHTPVVRRNCRASPARRCRRASPAIDSLRSTIHAGRSRSLRRVAIVLKIASHIFLCFSPGLRSRTDGEI